MCQVTVTTTTSPVTVSCSSASTTTITVTMAPTFMVLASALGQHDIVLTPPIIPRDTVRGVVDLYIVLHEQPQFQMLSQAYANCAVGPSELSFLFQS